MERGAQTPLFRGVSDSQESCDVAQGGLQGGAVAIPGVIRSPKLQAKLGLSVMLVEEGAKLMGGGEMSRVGQG